MEGIQELMVQLAALGGFGALIGFLINIMKTFGLIKDGQAGTWSTALNLLLLVVLLAVGVFAPSLDLIKIDAQVQQFVDVGVVVFAYIIQLYGAKLVHGAVRGVPLIGKSYSM